MRRAFFILLSFHVFFVSYATEQIYRFNDIFSISVTDSMELRQEKDAYTQFLRDTLHIGANNQIVFQQKQLSERTHEALSHYCRILINSYVDESCPYPCSNESVYSKDDIDDLIASCSSELAPSMHFIKYPTATIKSTLDGSKYVRLSYTRSGLNNKGEVTVYICYFFNYKYMVRAVFSYRSSESELWQNALQSSMNSFTWDSPFFTQDSNDVDSASTKSGVRHNMVKGNILLLILFGLFVAIMFWIGIRVAKRNRRAKEVSYVESKINEFVELLERGKVVSAEHILKSLKAQNSNCVLDYNLAIKEKEGILSDKVSEMSQCVSSVLTTIKDNLINEGFYRPSSLPFEQGEIPCSIKEQFTNGIKSIEEDYRQGIIPIQGETFTSYDLNICGDNQHYAFYRAPNRGTIVFPYRRYKIEHRGYMERNLEEKLRASFLSVANYQILGDVSLFVVEGKHPYEPDISIIERNDKYGIRIDIEVDEPYSGVSKKPIHYIGCGDDYRDMNLTHHGWIVIRFSEKQIATEIEQCVNYVKYVISLIDSDVRPDSYDFPTPDKRWTESESKVMSVMNYREKMLHHNFGNEEIESHILLGSQSFLERKAATHVKPIIFQASVKANIDHSSLDFSYDRELSFDSKEHIYLYKGLWQLKSISEVVGLFFIPFDSITISRNVALKQGVNQCKLLEEWDCMGQESKEIGTFLHTQIESYFLGNKPITQTRFLYEGKFVNKNEVVSISRELLYFIRFINDNALLPFRTEWRIFDLELGIAGTIDCICRNGLAFDIYDWKRSRKASPTETVWKYGINGLEHIPDISFYHYALQQNLYRYILETNYGLTINKMYIVVLHCQFNSYQKYEVPRMDKEIKIIINYLSSNK